MTEASAGVLRRIEGLLERAAHSSTPEAEREACQEKAEQMMATYRLERAMLDFGKKEKEKIHREPATRHYDLLELIDHDSNRNVAWKSEKYEYQIQHVINRLRKETYEFAGCATHLRWNQLVVVGYDEDIEYAGMVWTGLFLHVVDSIFPRWDKTKSMDHNVYTLKEAGFSWPQVREMGLRHDARDASGALTEKNAGSKLRTCYKREAKRRGILVEPGRQHASDPAWARYSFASAYETTIQQRFYDMAKRRESEAGEKGALALVEDHDRVLQKFYEMFPDLKPKPFDPDAFKDLPPSKGRKPKPTRYADPKAWERGNRAAKDAKLTYGQDVGTGRAGELE